MAKHSVVDLFTVHPSCIQCRRGEHVQQLGKGEDSQESFTVSGHSSGYPEDSN